MSIIVLDGSQGEGGGQILRTALSLAALEGRELRMENIRAHRPKPGLRPQHLTALRAVAAITRAEIRGDKVASTSLSFRPRGIFPGRYAFNVAEQVGSAGSVCLIAQTLLPILAHASQDSQVTLKGGTHVPWSPSAHYLSNVFLPALAEMGLNARLQLTSWGWYPQGGGEIRLSVSPSALINPIIWITSPRREDFQGLSVVANLPTHVVRRQAQRLRDCLDWPMLITEEQVGGLGQGSMVFVWGPRAGFAALGARGKPAEAVAEEAAIAFKGYLSSKVAVDRHLADQILPYLIQAQGLSVVTTEAVTSHLLTNAWVVQQFKGGAIQVHGELGEPGEIVCTVR